MLITHNNLQAKSSNHIEKEINQNNNNKKSHTPTHVTYSVAGFVFKKRKKKFSPSNHWVKASRLHTDAVTKPLLLVPLSLFITVGDSGHNLYSEANKIKIID